MPIYEYCCKDCKNEFEYLVFGSELPICPECESNKVARLMSACGFLSKGSSGETISSSATAASSCGSCSATSCAGCGS